MPVRTFALRVAMLATCTVVAACGGGGPSVAPTQAAPTQADEPSDAGPTFDLGTFTPPSFSLPSFTSDADLEALLPDTIGGQLVAKQSLTGEAILNSPFGAAPALEGMLTDVGASIDDMSLGVGSGGTVVVLAYQVDGVSAERIFGGIRSAIPSAAAPQISELSVAGRSVSQFVVGDETSYIYLAGDVVFIIGGTVTPELLDDAVSQLPAD